MRAGIKTIRTGKDMTMLRHLVLALAAATLAGTTLIPGDALAHHRGYRYWTPRYSSDLLTPDPRAGRAGYPGGRYGRDCYRAASGRSICPGLHFGTRAVPMWWYESVWRY
jgi:hypothetical protein